MADPSSFPTHAPQHVPAMRRAASALVGWADAEDVAQEAIVRAWQAWHTLHDISAVRPWLLRITVNVCLQWRRGHFGKHLELTEPLGDDDAAWLSTLDADPGTSDHTGALDLRSAINQLGGDMRLAILLRYYAGMDATEAGHVLGIPAATFRTRLRRALLALREQLGPAADALGTPAEVRGDVHV